ncbi:MAG TPA: nitronate monooxygenase [Actinomycetota bacterium]|nr:nitronate monooxygenase [Actinomycetota bacterium]
MIKTRLTEILGIEHPVMLAGMGGVSYHQLVAAVSEAGGFGTFGAATMSTEKMLDEIAELKKLTDKPFGVDLLTAMGDMTKQAEAAIDAGAAVYVGALGVPVELIDMCHRRGVLVVNMCGKVSHARQAVEAGCDIVVAQGTEAGGHTGRIATMPLVPQIVDAVGDKVPVVAAGGIFDGRGLAAALALGADGVWVGTRFIATPEARSTPGYKDALIAAAEDRTTITRAYTGKTLRALENSYTKYFEQHPEELQKFPLQAARSMQDGAMNLGSDDWSRVDPDKECFPSGQGVGAIDDLVPAGELVRRFVEEAEQEIDRVGSLRGVRVK